jgi:hypothetical protein
MLIPYFKGLKIAKNHSCPVSGLLIAHEIFEDLLIQNFSPES